jgi:hypothetical protein
MESVAQTAVWSERGLKGDTGICVHESAEGSYFHPSLLSTVISRPPQMIMSDPDHTAVWSHRAGGAPDVVTDTQKSPEGS